MKLRDAIVMVETIAELYDKMNGGTIWLSDFKRYIIQTHGSDEKTIRGYLNMLILFGLIKRNAYDPELLHLTYKESPEYKEIKIAQRKAWFKEESKDEPKTESEQK